MNIGYIKDILVLNDKVAYAKKLQQLNISKLYSDKQNETVNLRELLKYVREGDSSKRRAWD